MNLVLGTSQFFFICGIDCDNCTQNDPKLSGHSFGKKRHRKSLVLEQNLCIYEQQPDDKSKINGSHNIVHLLISDRKLKYRKEIKVITTKSKHTDV